MIQQSTSLLQRIAKTHLALTLGLLGCSFLLSAQAEAGEKYAVRAGTVHTLAGDAITNGVIVIEGGRITAVGMDMLG